MSRQTNVTRRTILGSAIALLSSIAKVRAQKHLDASSEETIVGLDTVDGNANSHLVREHLSRHNSLVFPQGRFPIVGPIFVKDNNTSIKGQGAALTEITLLDQDNPCFVIGGRGNPVSHISIGHLSINLIAERKKISPDPYTGDPRDPLGYGLVLRNWNAGIIHVFGSDLNVNDMNFRNLDAGIIFKGNLFDKQELQNGLAISNCAFYGCEFGIAIQQFVRARLTNLVGSGTTMIHDHTPHLIYVTDRSAAKSRDLIISNVEDRDNVFNSTVRIRNTDTILVKDISVNNCSRCIDLGRASNASIESVRYVSDASIDKGRRSMIDLRDCQNIEVKKLRGYLSADQSILRVADDGSPLISNNILLRDSYFEFEKRSRPNLLFDIRDGESIAIEDNIVVVNDARFPEIRDMVGDKGVLARRNVLSILAGGAGPAMKHEYDRYFASIEYRAKRRGG